MTKNVSLHIILLEFIFNIVNMVKENPEKAKPIESNLDYNSEDVSIARNIAEQIIDILVEKQWRH